jgi:hypothetical protein
MAIPPAAWCRLSRYARAGELAGVIATLVLLAAPGCGGAPKPAEILIDQVRGYNDGIRWRAYAEAAICLPTAEREGFLDRWERVDDDLRVDDYQLKRIRFRDQRRVARVDVEYTWHLDSRGIVHRTVTRQLWRRTGTIWLISEESRLRGPAMPGLSDDSQPSTSRQWLAPE